MNDPGMLHCTANVVYDDMLSLNAKFCNRIAVLDLIKSCGREKNIARARAIQAEVLKGKLLVKDVYIASALITAYFRCGSQGEAQQLFEQLHERNVVTWNALISGYAKIGLGDEALRCFARMKNDAGVFPNAVTYICALKACGLVGSLQIGEAVHAEVKKRGLLEKDVALGTALVDMYSKCGSLEKAREVFQQLPERNVVSWSALIAGYAQNGLGDEALECFKQMTLAGVNPDAITYICVLNACGIVGSLEIGAEIHAELRKQGLLEKDGVLGNALVDMYSKCGALTEALEVFEELPVRNIVTWNAIISGYAQNKLGNEALQCFERMKDAGVFPDAITYTCILKSCGMVGSMGIGWYVDSELRKRGLLEKDPVLGNALLDMYCKCGAMEEAEKVFERLPERNSIAWNALIAGYARHGLGTKALECFRKMKDANVCPDVSTYLCMLRICIALECPEIGAEIYAQVRNEGLLWEENAILGTALVDMYAKCGSLEKAQEVFDELPVQNVMSWSSLIDGYSRKGLGEEALACFSRMRDAGLHPDKVTYLCVLKACSLVGSVETGGEIDMEVRRQGLLYNDIVLGNAVVDMYSKCVELEKARQVFEQLPERNVVSWSALMAGYSQLGKAGAVLEMYIRMRAEHVAPNSFTFVVSLSACCHAGLLKEGEQLFGEMWKVSCVAPAAQHYACMADLFGRAGCVDKVGVLLDAVPRSDYPLILQSILGPCGKWGNVKLGRWAFDELVRLDAECSAAYICMENIYASAGMESSPVHVS